MSSRFRTPLAAALLLLLGTAGAAPTPADYVADRARFVRNDSRWMGSGLVLSEEESDVNRALMADKFRELELGFRNLSAFPPANHFFKVKEEIENSTIFNFIKKMPKGAMLHGHDFGMVSTEYLVRSLTYRQHLYFCHDGEGQLLLRFFLRPDNSCASWKEVAQERRDKGNDTVDDFFRRHLTLVVDNPEEDYPDLNTVWKKFQRIFTTVIGMVTYKPVFEDFYYQTLLEFLQDGVIYLELRGVLPDLYDLEGNVFSGVQTLAVYHNVTERFKEEHSDFFGARFIYAPSRHVDSKVMDRYVNTTRDLLAEYPDFVLGFDLVGQEDSGRPLSYFTPQLLQMAPHTRFFFHAGETNWQGRADENLVDAVLLNTTRIGHGFALPKHPYVLEEVEKKDIAIEVNPISNQVLKLVADLRNHPCAMLIAKNYSVVIAPDDPSFFGSKGISYDLYLAFMGMAPEKADLRLLKQFALNSIRYSALSDEEKSALRRKWEDQWSQFIVARHSTPTPTPTAKLT